MTTKWATKWVCSNRMPMPDGSCACGHGPHVRVGGIITCDECNTERARRAYREAVLDDFDRRRFINRKDIDMSWGYEKTGTLDALVKDVTAYFDRIAEGYKEQPEADDVIACKGRILALMAACDLTTEANAINVKANGSHSTGGKGLYSASFYVQVTRVALAL